MLSSDMNVSRSKIAREHLKIRVKINPTVKTSSGMIFALPMFVNSSTRSVYYWANVSIRYRGSSAILLGSRSARKILHKG